MILYNVIYTHLICGIHFKSTLVYGFFFYILRTAFVNHELWLHFNNIVSISNCVSLKP